MKLGTILDTKSKANLDRLEAEVHQADRQHADDFILNNSLVAIIK